MQGGVKMAHIQNATYHEAMQRGTLDFPAELYKVDDMHPRYQMQLHWHRDFELIRVLSGTLRVFSNEDEKLLSSGESAFIPGGIVHGAVAEKAVYECIVFSSALLYPSDRCREIIKSGVNQSHFFRNNPNVDKIFTAISEKSAGYEFEFLSGVYEIIKDIASAPNFKERPFKNSKYEKIKTALAIIEENYNSHFALEQLAAACDMSPNYFCRFFKEMTQKTPFDYINIYRINVACEMLTKSSETITDIAYSCGFNDLSYFIKIFKKYKGVSPNSYRKHMQ